MFENFEESLLSDPNFKEDSVREVIISPILSRLGYHPTGSQVVIRSKTLSQPFIYAGTRRHPVNIIPDYTLYYNDVPVLVLDAKSPSESVESQANIQQAYSYAIHPEVQVSHFALCNGKSLAVFSTTKIEPLLKLDFNEFESRWEEIEKYLLPKFLLKPELRKMAPDFGLAVSRLGIDSESELMLIGARLNMFAKMNEGQYTVTVNTDFAGKDHCVSFDFKTEQLSQLLSGLPVELKRTFSEALAKAPFQAAADLCIEVDLQTHLGALIEVEHESFIPLIIDQVLGSRFVPEVPDGGDDIPPHIFRLSKAFKVVDPESTHA